MADAYEKLRERLDDLSTGYPETESRVKILERLFGEKDAELFLRLTPLLEAPEDAACSRGRGAE